jgi:hypothetical protein
MPFTPMTTSCCGYICTIVSGLVLIGLEKTNSSGSHRLEMVDVTWTAITTSTTKTAAILFTPDLVYIELSRSSDFRLIEHVRYESSVGGQTSARDRFVLLRYFNVVAENQHLTGPFIFTHTVAPLDGFNSAVASVKLVDGFHVVVTQNPFVMFSQQVCQLLVREAVMTVASVAVKAFCRHIRWVHEFMLVCVIWQ